MAQVKIRKAGSNEQPGYYNKTNMFLKKADEGTEVQGQQNNLDAYSAYADSQLRNDIDPQTVYTELINKGLKEDVAYTLITSLVSKLVDEGEINPDYKRDEVVETPKKEEEVVVPEQTIVDPYQDMADMEEANIQDQSFARSGGTYYDEDDYEGQNELFNQYQTVKDNEVEPFSMEELINSTAGTQQPLNFSNLNGYIPDYQNLEWVSQDYNPDNVSQAGSLVSEKNGGIIKKKTFVKNIMALLKKEEGGEGAEEESLDTVRGNPMDNMTDDVQKNKSNFLNAIKTTATTVEIEKMYDKLKKSNDPALQQLGAQPNNNQQAFQAGGMTGGDNPLYRFLGGGQEFQEDPDYYEADFLPEAAYGYSVGNLRRAEEGMEQNEPSPEEMAMMQQQQGAPQQEGQGNPLAQIEQQVQQMLQQGTPPEDVVNALLQKQIPPETIMQIFVEIGVPQEKAQVLIQQAMQQGQQQNPQEEVAEGPQGQNPKEEMMEAPMARYGYETNNELRKAQVGETGKVDYKINPATGQPWTSEEWAAKKKVIDDATAGMSERQKEAWIHQQLLLRQQQAAQNNTSVVNTAGVPRAQINYVPNYVTTPGAWHRNLTPWNPIFKRHHRNKHFGNQYMSAVNDEQVQEPGNITATGNTFMNFPGQASRPQSNLSLDNLHRGEYFWTKKTKEDEDTGVSERRGINRKGQLVQQETNSSPYVSGEQTDWTEEKEYGGPIDYTDYAYGGDVSIPYLHKAAEGEEITITDPNKPKPATPHVDLTPAKMVGYIGDVTLGPDSPWAMPTPPMGAALNAEGMTYNNNRIMEPDNLNDCTPEQKKDATSKCYVKPTETPFYGFDVNQNLSTTNDPEAGVNVFNNMVVAPLTNFLNTADRKANERKAYDNLNSDNQYTAQATQHKGDVVVTGQQLGEFRPNKQSQERSSFSSYGKYGGYMQDGGSLDDMSNNANTNSYSEGDEVYMTDDDIRNFMAQGGQVKYI